MDVEYRILGPLDVSVDGRAVALGGRHQRALLALLLAQANEVVPLDRLIDGLWDEAPPETAANIVQGYVSQLRKLLGRETIVTRGRGYALIAADGALDLQRFEQRAAAGTAEHAAGRPEAAAAELRAALARLARARRSATSPIFPRCARSPCGSTSCGSRRSSAASAPTSSAATRPRRPPSSTR